MTRRLLLIAAALCATALASCKKGEDAQQPAPETKTTTAAAIPAAPVPTFDASRAFADISKQVAFGPRVPNSIDT